MNMVQYRNNLRMMQVLLQTWEVHRKLTAAVFGPHLLCSDGYEQAER